VLAVRRARLVRHPLHEELAVPRVHAAHLVGRDQVLGHLGVEGEQVAHGVVG
jgi:hypothetical protein